MDEELVVVLSNDAPAVQQRMGPGHLLKEIWREITFGVGAWGAFRPLITAMLALVPFLFLGQHFNREHRRAVEWSFLQIPLAFTLVLWIGLYAWSIFDAWRDAVAFLSRSQGQS